MTWVALAGIARHTGAEDEWRQAIEQARCCVGNLAPYDGACLESVAGNVDRALQLLALAVQQDGFDAKWAS